MRIKRLEMQNFFRIYGTEIINFSTNEVQNVTVIKGENGMGKTTILSAFCWAFYGDVVTPLTIFEMLNKKTRSEMKPSDLQIAAVSVDFIEKGIEYTFHRAQKFRKEVDGRITVFGSPEFYILNKKSAIPINDKRYFENIIPQELRGFFFFDGERIDRLAKIDGKQEIKKAILDILGLTSLEQINENLTAIKKDFNIDIQKRSKDIGLKELNEQYKGYSSQFEQIKLKIDEEIKKLKKIKAIKNECDIYLSEHNAAKVRELTARREKLEVEKESIENRDYGKIITAQKLIMSHISKNLKIFLLSNFYPQISLLLEDKRKKKELPSDIKVTFVQDLIDSGECICGRSLSEGTAEYSLLNDLLKTAGREELDNAYIKIISFINSNSTKESINTFFPEMYKSLDQIFVLNERIEEIKKDLSEINNQLKNSDDEIISAREDQRERAEEDIENITKNIVIDEISKSKCENELKILTEKIEKAQGKGKESDLYSKCFSVANSLLQLNSEIREYFIRITQEDMDAKLKEVFAMLAKKQDREPILTQDFELKIVNKTTKSIQVLSTGERQITSLAFIGALVSYAKEKPEMKMISDFFGGDFPIVMDSPFGNLDPTHKSNVAAGIPQLASQVIVIVSSSQWNGEVSDNMYSKVGKIYEMFEGQTTEADSEYTYLKEVK